jgi:hypothetical protein
MSPLNKQCTVSVSVFRDILKRIRILWSVHLITDPDVDLGPDPIPFLSGFQDANKKYLNFCFSVFCLLLSVGTFPSVFKDNK